MQTFRRIWQLSLLSFIIAAFSGFLYRYAMLFPVHESLNLANIRHAHSHLMFFNWVCPPIMIWMIFDFTNTMSPAIRQSFKICFYVMLFLGFLSFPFFLFYGYQSVPIGNASLPFAAIISGLVMLTWYWFAWLYYSLKKSEPDSIARLLFDGALLALLISSLGAWGVSIFQFTAIDSPLISSAMTHFFLTVFTEGWAVLGILGIIWAKSKTPDNFQYKGWLWMPILFGSMMIFPFSLTQSLITSAMLYTAYAGVILTVIALSINVYLLYNAGAFSGFIWKTVLVLIVLKILFKVAAILPFDIWPGEHGLRVLYLHLLLLGIITIVLFERFQPLSKPLFKNLFVISALLVILSLVLISGYWPPVWTPPNPYFWIIIISILPAITAIPLFVESFKNRTG